MSKTSLLALHRSLALVFAPLLLLQALTGAALLFRGPLARLVDLAGMTASARGPSVTVSTLAASAEARFASYRVQRMFLPVTREGTVFVELAGADGSTRFASLDPASARVLAAGSVWRFPLEAALRLHYRLMNGRVGLCLILANGIILALLAGSGLGFWWPGRTRVLKALAIRKSTPKRLKLRLWHRSGGVTLSVVLLFSAATGILLVAPDIPEGVGQANLGPAPLRSPTQIDDAVALARAQFPGSPLRDIRFPVADRIDLNFSAPERNPRAVHMVSVAVSRREIIKSLRAAQNGVLWMKVLPLHTGDSFGIAGRLMLLVEASMLAFLAISGPTMWWRGRRARRGGK